MKLISKMVLILLQQVPFEHKITEYNNIFKIHKILTNFIIKKQLSKKLLKSAEMLLFHLNNKDKFM